MRNSDAERLLTKVYVDNFSWFQRYVLKNSGTLEDAADIFQEGVSAAWLNLREGKFSGGAEQFNAYVRQICKYKWINVLRAASGRIIRMEADIGVYEDLVDGEEVERSVQQSHVLRASFSTLGEKCRELLGRFYFKRQSLAHIAALMNNTEESIKTIKYRCMMRLRKAYLEKYNNDE
ncbi:RNA polymerase sigma factor [Parapedobacter sp. 2B3]|uniref:RNA polymerase sigma factor n=1 Tax=Parapedobacter sp. 2B3 TaxID=3342381 RepID=UPI0035B59ABA